jgi:hypothetical protein
MTQAGISIIPYWDSLEPALFGQTTHSRPESTHPTSAEQRARARRPGLRGASSRRSLRIPNETVVRGEETTGRSGVRVSGAA